MFVHQVKGTRGTYIANVAVTGSQKYNQITVISFNKGANWSPVTAPTLDSDMLPVECYYVSVIIYIHENIYDNATSKYNNIHTRPFNP